jgi:hypothetical protein
LPTGSISFDITDLRGRPVAGRLRIDFDPHEGSAGGAPARADFEVEGHQRFSVDGIECLDVGTIYEVRVKATHYKPYSFFQLMRPGSRTIASEGTIRLMVDPRKVSAITPPSYARLPAAFRTGLEQARMFALASEDSDLVGLKGEALYGALGPRRQACLLNLVAKAKHDSADRITRFVRIPMVLRQDRCFAEVDPAMREFLCKSDRYTSAPGALHEPPPGFERLDSFKSDDANGNVQVTFMRQAASGALWADIDIDEATGLRHGFEVIRNAITDGRTNPYLVREILLRTSPADNPIDPGYDFVLA